MSSSSAADANRTQRKAAPLPGSERVDDILHILAEAYPDPQTELIHHSAFELLIATILSAQATDRSVNEATPALFARYPTPQAMAQAEGDDLHPFIGRIGLYRNKARFLVEASRALVEKFEGEVPRTREALMSLPGVGRKTANVVLANAFGIPAFAVDTHVLRVSSRLGLSRGESPEEVEQALTETIPEALWIDAHHWLIFHGRRVCSARLPRCQDCRLQDLCPSRR